MEVDEDFDPTVDDGITWRGNERITKANNTLQIWGNKETMNMNSLILDNIKNSPYFKNNLYSIHTYHEVIDEIYYNVEHLEPWEKGSRKLAGTTGARAMEVRGVSSGGIVSSAFCLLYKLYTMKITRKQLYGLINYAESPYIRGIGFLYIRYTQAPKDLWSWLSPYFDDEEMVDPRAGAGDRMTVGQMVITMLKKLDWYSTLFPRIPVPVQKEMEENFRQYYKEKAEAARENAGCRQVLADSSTGQDVVEAAPADSTDVRNSPGVGARSGRADRSRSRDDRRDGSQAGRGSRHQSPSRRRRSRSKSRSRKGDKPTERHRSRDRGSRSQRRRSRSRENRPRKSRSRERRDDRKRKRSRSRDGGRPSKSKKRSRSTSRSKSKKSKHSHSHQRSKSRSRSKSHDSMEGKPLPEPAFETVDSVAVLESDKEEVDLSKYDVLGVISTSAENEKNEKAKAPPDPGD